MTPHLSACSSSFITASGANLSALTRVWGAFDPTFGHGQVQVRLQKPPRTPIIVKKCDSATILYWEGLQERKSSSTTMNFFSLLPLTYIGAKSTPSFTEPFCCLHIGTVSDFLRIFGAVFHPFSWLPCALAPTGGRVDLPGSLGGLPDDAAVGQVYWQFTVALLFNLCFLFERSICVNRFRCCGRFSLGSKRILSSVWSVIGRTGPRWGPFCAQSLCVMVFRLLSSCCMRFVCFFFVSII